MPLSGIPPETELIGVTRAAANPCNTTTIEQARLTALKEEIAILVNCT